MSIYTTPASAMFAKEMVEEHDSRLRADRDDYNVYGGHIEVKEQAQHHLRAAAIIALVCAPFSFLLAPLIAALALGHYALAHTRRDTAVYEDRTRGIATISLLIGYVSLAMMLLDVIFSLHV